MGLSSQLGKGIKQAEKGMYERVTKRVDDPLPEDSDAELCRKDSGRVSSKSNKSVSKERELTNLFCCPSLYSSG